MSILENAVNQAISDFDEIQEKAGIPDGTPTSEYDDYYGSGGSIEVDQEFNPDSENAQSGKAVAEAVESVDSKIKYVESLDTDNLLDLFSMESGTYILLGKFRPYPNAPNTFNFSKLQLVSVSKGSLSTCVQVFYPPYNAIQYLNIWADEESDTGYTYERKDAKLYYMEDTRNMTNTVDENSDDTHYPSAKAVYDAIGKNSPIKYVESLDEENIVNLRDLETGNYVLYGYFSPYENSHTTMTADNSFVNVYHIAEGSHIFCFEPLNAKVVFIEILVDETNAKGYTYSRTIIDMLELNGLIERVGTVETQIGDIETALDELHNYAQNLIAGGVSE